MADVVVNNDVEWQWLVKINIIGKSRLTNLFNCLTTDLSISIFQVTQLANFKNGYLMVNIDHLTNERVIVFVVNIDHLANVWVTISS